VNLTTIKKKILIIAENDDATADQIVLRLRQMGQDPVRTTWPNIAFGNSICIGICNGACEGTIKTRNQQLALNEIGVVFCRSLEPSRLPANIASEASDFAILEAESLVQGLIKVFGDSWINIPTQTSAITSRLWQLLAAQAVRFVIPRTLVTADFQKIEEFARDCGGQVLLRTLNARGDVKPARLFAADCTEEQKKIGPTLIDINQIRANSSEISAVPCMVEEVLAMESEIHAAVIGSTVFEIRPMLDPATPASTSESLVLTHTDREKCVQLARSLHLNCCILRFIYSKSGILVFLDAVANPEWAQIQNQFRSIPLVNTIAATLVDHCVNRP